MQAVFFLSLLFADISGECTSVIDGDTIRVFDGERSVIVRLHGIDAPESKQPYGLESKADLVRLVQGRHCNVIDKGHDRYGRLIGVVLCDGIDVNAEQVCLGNAWQFTKYDRSKYLYRYELGARTLRRGLWADESPVSPWDWRKGER